ncbi:hypothetical protein ACC754_40360, partial [Rhizobium johnstonii]
FQRGLAQDRIDQHLLWLANLPTKAALRAMTMPQQVNKGDEGEHLLTPENIDRLAVLTEGFFRFIDEGKDASVVTLWRGGTPIVQQI